MADPMKELRILSPGAMREIVCDLSAAYERETGVKISSEFTRAPLVRDRISAGESFDIVVTTQSRIEELAAARKVVADTVATIAQSGIGIAVSAGQPKPDISSVDAFIRTLRNANSIACADSAFGTASGLYLVRLFDRLGLAAELASKIRLIGTVAGKPIVVCAPVANGEAEIGIQQIAEIVAVPGVDLVGPLPAEIQHTTAFSVAVAATAQDQDLARDYVAFLTSEAAEPVIRAHGMQPFRTLAKHLDGY
jgi:molybdate transport system substrate-binding protein